MIGKRDVSIATIAAMAAVMTVSGAAASEPGAAPDEGGAVVMLAERGDTVAAGVVIRAVQAQLSDVSVALRVIWIDALAADLPSQIAKAEEIANGSAAVAVFWCDLARADRFYLYFAAPKGGRVLVRELAGSGTGGMAEALAIIVRSSVEAVLAGGEIGAVVAPAPRSAGPVEAGPPPSAGAGRDRERLAVTVGYELDVVSNRSPVVHSGAIGLSVRIAEHLSIRAGYVVSEPRSAEERGALLELGRHPFWLGGSAFWRAGRLRLAVDVALQLDVVTERVRATEAGVAVASGGREVEPSIVPSFRVAAEIVRRVALFLSAGADVALHRTRYVVSTPTGPVELLSTWPVRPRFVAGLEVALW